MKKIAITSIFIAGMAVNLFAYNPPVNGESFLELSSPKTLTESASVAGGALFSAGPDSLIANPALTAGEQRVNLNLGYTALLSENEINNAKFGNAFQLGILIPTKWYVYSAYVNGTFVPFQEMNLSNSINIKGGLSKEITEKLDVGLGINTGFIFGTGMDWGLSGNLGFVYNMGNLSFMKDFRIAASVLNLGKNYSKVNLPGIYTSEEKPELCGMFPMIGALKAGASATLLSTDVVKIGTELDLTFPGFQNVIFDAGLKFALKDMLVLSVSEKINLRESIAGIGNYIPSVGLSFTFNFDVKNSAYLERNGWSESEMRIAAAYKKMYTNVNAISGSVDLILGMQDATPPAIKIWFDEPEDEE